MFGAPSALGVLVRRLADQREELTRALSELAEQQRLREQAAVEMERRRIAAEMHDVVAHAVSLMAVQVGAARLQLESQGCSVPPQLRAAEETGRNAVADLRRSLGVLRGSNGVPDLDPMPDLSALPMLIARFEEAGLPIRFVSADDSDLPPSLQLAAYRIVQEALTNVLKHSGRVPVTVCVEQTAGALEVTVSNGPGKRLTDESDRDRAASQPSGHSSGLSSGHGLSGMRERVAIYDGRFSSGTTAEGGFEVFAQLPVPAFGVAQVGSA